MPARDLEVEIRRKGRREDIVDVTADPGNTAALQQFLRDWLAGNGWAEGLWRDFSADVRLAGEGKVRRTVRP